MVIIDNLDFKKRLKMLNCKCKMNYNGLSLVVIVEGLNVCLVRI